MHVCARLRVLNAVIHVTLKCGGGVLGVCLTASMSPIAIHKLMNLKTTSAYSVWGSCCLQALEHVSWPASHRRVVASTSTSEPLLTGVRAQCKSHAFKSTLRAMHANQRGP